MWNRDAQQSRIVIDTVKAEKGEKYPNIFLSQCQNIVRYSGPLHVTNKGILSIDFELNKKLKETKKII